MADVLVVTEHLQGEFQDITFEMLGKGRQLAAALGGQCSALVFGNMRSKAAELGAARRVLAVGGSDDYNPAEYAAAVTSVVQDKAPAVVLVASTSMGMDLAPVVGTTLGIPVVAYCSALAADGDVVCTSQLYGGKMNTVSAVPTPAVIMVLAGAFDSAAGRVSGSPEVEDFSPAGGKTTGGAGKVRFVKIIEPAAADVDITQSGVLVAVGRGIGSKDDIELAEELAEALEADLACSRPIVDAGWLPKARQVGKSGLKVKPKLYLALGISGAPEHIEGMQSSATIIAVNTDEHAPIFDVAHYGLVEDLFDVCEELLEELE